MQEAAVKQPEHKQLPGAWQLISLIWLLLVVLYKLRFKGFSLPQRFSAVLPVFQHRTGADDHRPNAASRPHAAQAGGEA